VTVSCGDRNDHDVAVLHAWATKADVKLTHVVLARGRVPSQPMLTLTGSGTLAAQHAAASRLTAELADAGFRVTRVKVEAAPWTRGVPQTDAAARDLGPGFYFEHHVKLVCSASPDELAHLADLVVPHRAHLSWNARRVRSDGRAERFVTQRCFQVGDASADAELADLRAALIADGHEIVSVEREFVVYDIEECAGRLDLLHCAIQRARTAVMQTC
jgi:hypothetical protein